MFFSPRAIAAAILAVLLCSEQAASHSWIDELGGERGQKGYIRDWGGREVPDVDIRFSYRLQGPEIQTKQICKENQRNPVNSASYPRLKARPGELVTSSHFENGHVTLLDRPDSFSGFMYWFGTASPRADTTFGEVISWGDGREGAKNGKLLMVNPYDDGSCAESNNSPISARRGVGPSKPNKACKGYFRLPADLKPGSTYAVYWVWDFSWKYGVSVERREEWYTSCMDIDIV